MLIVYCGQHGIIILTVVCVLLHDKRKIIIKLAQSKKDLEEANSKLKTNNDDLEESLHCKNDFLLNIFHDLRNPLNIIVGNIELALHSNNRPDKTRSYMENSKINCEILLHLITNLLDAGKLEASNLEISPVHTNVTRKCGPPPKSWFNVRDGWYRLYWQEDTWIPDSRPSSVNASHVQSGWKNIEVHKKRLSQYYIFMDSHKSAAFRLIHSHSIITVQSNVEDQNREYRSSQPNDMVEPDVSCDKGVLENRDPQTYNLANQIKTFSYIE